MPSFIYMPGFSTALMVQENPDVVQEAIDAAEISGETFVTLNAAGYARGEAREIGRQGGAVIMEEEITDSFVPIKFRASAVFVIRQEHPGEVPEP